MTLPKKVKSLEAIPEAFRSLYEEKNGEFVLTLEVEGLVDETVLQGLVKNKEEILAEKKALAERFKDVDLDRYQELLKADEESKRKQSKDKNDWESREAQLLEKFKKDLDSRDSALKSLRGQLETVLIDDALTNALLGAGAKSKGGVKLLIPHARNFVQVRESEDGRLQAFVVDDGGKERISVKDGKAGSMSFSELAAELRESEEFQGCFEAKGTSGGGAPGGDRTTGGAMVVKSSDLKIPARYVEIKAEAEKRGIPMDQVQVVD